MKQTHPHVAAVGVGVQVVRVDVEGDEADGGEGRRVDDGHVVGGVDADGGHVGAGTGAHVGDAVLDERQGDGKTESRGEAVKRRISAASAAVCRTCIK